MENVQDQNQRDLTQQKVQLNRARLVVFLMFGIGTYVLAFAAAYDFGKRAALKEVSINTQQSLQFKYDHTKVHQVHVGALTSIRVLPGEKIQQVVAEDNIQWEFKLNPNDTAILVKNREPLAKNNRLIIDTDKTQYTLILKPDKASKTMLVEYVR